eukprot:CAMPEP_0173441570 /NCGR_PEP_ID=MMETSP1357-20121228/24028_1 /TAXON_ID=77926 /ORGANISM="Hemiselmis rufescens, Strain PCC563" /LENGTH=538 /DNA_ID=CAMNT_0014407159 /DNA_START=75 /DNA_END=1687 /DNA_ORIENTATION=+
MASGAVPKDKSVENQIWLEDIYNYLYTQKGNDPPPPIHIPSTVMLKYQRPCAWFSSSSDGELIKRSDNKELDPHVIKRQFCEGAKNDCVAYYVSYTKGSKGQRSAKIEYFDDKGLENFLLHRQKENNGIVQKFEEPTSPYNTLIRAYWTPHKLTLQQRVNKHQLSNTAVVMNERLATFDGPEHLNVEFDIKSYKLKSRLEEGVSSIVNHVRKLLPSAYTLWTMECYFKLSGKNKLLFLWCNDLRVFNTNDPPKIEAFLAPPINAAVASKHKYEKKDLKKEYFKCPCAEFNIDSTCAKVGGLFDVSQMKITTYRYMILYHQSQSPIEKDVKIPEDDEYSKLSPYRKRWIEEDEMIKFKENQEVKAYELKNGSLVYQMQKNRDYVRELTGWEQIPPLPVSNADPLVFKFLSKLAISEGKVLLAHNLGDYGKQDVADFRRFYVNVVNGAQKGGVPFLEKKMKVCDGCCIKFNSSADDNMSLEMTKLVVGPPSGSLNTTRRGRSRASTTLLGGDTTSLMSSPQFIKTMRSDSTLPVIKQGPG